MSRRCPRWSSSAAILIAITILTCCPALGPIAADDKPSSTSDAGNDEEFRQYAKMTAAEYELHLRGDGDRKLSLRDDAILRWTNPLGGAQAHGEVFLWTDRGRPEAVLSLYQVTDSAGVHEHHEFSSLALRGLTAERSGKVAWAPAAAGMEMKRFPDAPPLQGPPRLRAGQMRKLVEQLTADKTTREDVKRELRLLPQPVYRYEGEHPDVLVGALYAFVEATDPEVFLLLEARADGKQYEWHYGVVRMNSVRVRVFQGEKLLWETPTLPWEDVFNRPDKPYTALRIR